MNSISPTYRLIIEPNTDSIITDKNQKRSTKEWNLTKY
jgi:hypothetical protein